MGIEQEQQEEQQQHQQQQHQQQWQQKQYQPRIYDVTDGIPSNQTREVYQRYFNRFLDYIKIKDRQVLLDFSPKVIKQMIADYILYLHEKRNVKRDSIKVQLSAILRFFQINNDEFHLTTRNFQRDLPPNESTSSPYGDDRPYTTEEIALTLQSCDLRTRVAILLLCSSGMRIGALHSLQIGDLTTVRINNSNNIYKIQVYARTRDKYYTFCAPECYSTIADYYLADRKRCGEKLNDKSPLIREQFNAENPFTINSPRFVSTRGIEYMISHTLKRAGVRKPKAIHMSHGFRKFFKSQAEYSLMKSINIELLMGHNIGVSGHYYRPTEAEVLEDFKKAIDSLTISSENRLKKQLETTEQRHSAEWEALKAQMNDLRELLNLKV
ncbi:MAG: tyrosine-type recombinase/integrase [Nitrososphaeraceae archaeon]